MRELKVGDLVIPKGHRWNEGMVEVIRIWGNGVKVKYHGQRIRREAWLSMDDVTPDTARTRDKKLGELGI